MNLMDSGQANASDVPSSLSATVIGTHLAAMLNGAQHVRFNEIHSEKRSDIDFVAHVYVMPGLLLLGIVNQSLNFLTLNTLASAGYLYLKAAAVADIISIIALIPFCIRHSDRHNIHSYPAMFFHAHVELPLINSLITASAFCLAAMTMDRYLSIRHPITFYNTPACKTRIRHFIVILYGLSFVIFIPSGWQKKMIAHWDSRKNTVYWTIERRDELKDSVLFQVYLCFREVLARIGPILVLTLLNIGMIRSLRRIKTRYNSRRVNQPPRVREMDRTRISVLLLITSATFIICTLPASILSLFVSRYNETNVKLQLFRAFANCLQVSHYLHNFYLYILCSSEYRHAFLKLIGCYKPNRFANSTGESPTLRLSNALATQFWRWSGKYTGRIQVPTAGAPLVADTGVPSGDLHT